MDWVPPQEFDGYRLINPLGRGGMGQVYLGKDLLLERAVAIKFIATREPDDLVRRQFVVEGRAIARLSHPNVVAVHRVSEVEGHPYLVYEYVRGRSLDAIERPMPWEKALQIGIGLARGLAAAHRQGVLHRDIKPANAVLAEDGNVKLLDFGLAEVGAVTAERHRESHPSSHPWVGLVPQRSGDTESTEEFVTVRAFPGQRLAGTPRYMAPEVLAGEPASRRSDLYSVGVLLFELCAGHPPRRDEADGSIRPLVEEANSVHPRLAAIIDRCLEPEPSRRWASADELLDALEQVAPTHRSVPLPLGNPYRGLRPFDAEHRALFFGRDADVRAVIDRLRSDPLVAIAGDSGVGKSSLCRAGVLPLVAEGGPEGGLAWSVARLVPGRDPIGQLASAVAPALKIDAEALKAWLHSEPTALARAFQRVRQAQPELALLVFVDQAEELVSIASMEEASHFGASCGAALTMSRNLHWLLTVRGDMVTRLASLPGLGEELQRSLFILRPLSPERLREAVVGPARTFGVTFESDAMVDGLVSAGQPPRGSLPLLQFALSELWEARDAGRARIPESALDAIGGVVGALARHADGVLAQLLPAQRDEARRILLRLVSSDGTRTRRAADELGVGDETAARALDALVVGRLVVARDRAGQTEYVLAHEALARSWSTLSAWLDADSEMNRARQRLTDAAAEWERLDRSPDALWHRRQLSEVREMAPRTLGERERTFLVASWRHSSRRRLLSLALALAVLGLAALGTLAPYARSRATIRARVGAYRTQASDATREARAAAVAAAARRTEAFRLFDGTWRTRPGAPPNPADVRWDEAEAVWVDALGLEARADAAYSRATSVLELMLLVDPERSSVRTEIADLLFEQLTQSERRRGQPTPGLRDRLLALDIDGHIRRKLDAPGTLALSVIPAAAQLRLERYEPAGQLLRPKSLSLPELRSGAELSLAPGSYRLVVIPGDGTTIYDPFVIRAGERAKIVLRLPSAGSVPPGFVYIPAGRFLVGSADDESLRMAQTAPPLHEVETDAYLISQSEATFAQWIEYLEAVGVKAREHFPNVERTKGVVRLRRDSNRWILHLRPTSKEYVARWGEPIRYEGRDRLSVQDWRRFPVSGISLVDIQDYLRWLGASRRLPGARLCTDWEWERAARGADGRIFTTGNALPASAANVDVTYGRNSVAFGPDEVGSHPESDSPFEIHDLAGNALEVVGTRRPEEAATGRGGAWYLDIPFSARNMSHEPLESQSRAAYMGFRVCASADTPR
jgi:eukaryotic-like serine/threonine-protein kinase